MLIRQATMIDWEQIYEIVKKNSSSLGPVSPLEIRNFINRSSCCVCEISKKIVGFILYTPLKRIPYLLTLNVLCVCKEYRRHHIATDMIQYLQRLYNRNIKTTCVKDSESEVFWSKIGIKLDESSGKKRPICRYYIPSERRNLLNGF